MCFSAESRSSAGPSLPRIQKAVLWAGLGMDIGSKASLCVSLWRFAHRGKWWWFGLVLGFFMLSSAACVLYWMTHYPAALAEEDLRASKGKALHSDQPHSRVYGERVA